MEVEREGAGGKEPLQDTNREGRMRYIRNSWTTKRETREDLEKLENTV